MSPQGRTREQYDEAVQAAIRAFELTRKLPAYERGRIPRDISAGVRERCEELGRTITLGPASRSGTLPGRSTARP